MRHPDPAIRRCLRVLAAVHELHKLGYQRLRIAPGMSPAGTAWRCGITPVTNIRHDHGALASDLARLTVHYSSGMSNEYFGWSDARHDNARDIAAKLVARFPEVIEAARGRDWAYVGWYAEMLGIAERGHLPVAYADWYEEPGRRWLPTTAGFESGLPMPPPGEAGPQPGGSPTRIHGPSVAISEPVLLIRISRLYRPGMSAEALYEATRGVWVLGVRRERARFAFAVFDEVVREVYEIEDWHPAGSTPYATRTSEDVSRRGRWEFTGRVAPANVRERYLGRSLAGTWEQGAANPVTYVNC